MRKATVTTETDTEVIAHLVEKILKTANGPQAISRKAVRKTVAQLTGVFALSRDFS